MEFVTTNPRISKPRVRGSNPLGRATFINIKNKIKKVLVRLVAGVGFEPLTLGLEMRGFVVTNCIELSRFVILQ